MSFVNLNAQSQLAQRRALQQLASSTPVLAPVSGQTTGGITNTNGTLSVVGGGTSAPAISATSPLTYTTTGSVGSLALNIGAGLATTAGSLAAVVTGAGAGLSLIGGLIVSPIQAVSNGITLVGVTLGLTTAAQAGLVGTANLPITFGSNTIGITLTSGLTATSGALAVALGTNGALAFNTGGSIGINLLSTGTGSGLVVNSSNQLRVNTGVGLALVGNAVQTTVTGPAQDGNAHSGIVNNSGVVSVVVDGTTIKLTSNTLVSAITNTFVAVSVPLTNTSGTLGLKVGYNTKVDATNALVGIGTGGASSGTSSATLSNLTVAGTAVIVEAFVSGISSAVTGAVTASITVDGNTVSVSAYITTAQIGGTLNGHIRAVFNMSGNWVAFFAPAYSGSGIPTASFFVGANGGTITSISGTSINVSASCAGATISNLVAYFVNNS